MRIIVSNEVLDLGHQLFDAAKSTAPDRLLGNDVEPDFDLVEPGSVGRRVMHLEARMCRQPALHGGMLVRGVVIHDQMHCEPVRNLRVDLSQKTQVLLVAMTAQALREHRARGQVQCGK